MKKAILSALFVGALFFSCSKDDSENVATVEYSFDTDANSGLMFKDGDAVATMTSEAMRFDIGKVLRVKAINETTIEVANFAPVDIEDATILVTIEGQPKPIKLFKIKKIRAHGVKEIKYPFVEKTTNFFDTENAEVSLSQYRTTGIATTKVTFDFTGETELIQKLKLAAKLKWKVKPHDFDPTHDPNNNWKDNVTAADFRRYIGFIINNAYLMQTEEAKNAFLEEPIYGNDGVTLMTLEEKKVAFQKFIDITNINGGVVVNVSGLGGGATFGVANHVLHDYLTKDPCFITIHEMGHMIGYNHDSSMTYPKKIDNVDRGATVAIGKIYTQLLKSDAFPIKVKNYYMPSDLLL
ncbi:hypothetical protein [Flavobacterium aquidurense]|uniref:hypothetical protein n=1 Tax=Flavobacterium aquidurense TaxID=362413 RepID=UPI002862A17F|nr:hypothetical protein [Flavobacterium aquidurense]MDR7373018.1 hypothetical protein [Flavobacterium aquidurense]